MQHPNLLLAQLNPTVGDIAGNAQKILAVYREADKNRASIVVTPELSLIGYPPEDLILMPAFRAEAMKKAREVASATTDAGLVFGTLWEEGGAVYNAAVFAAEGRIQHIHYKIMLPNEGVFDESRIFAPGHHTRVFEWKGMRLALMVCEDVWHMQHAHKSTQQHVELVIAINASPFEIGKLALRKKVVAQAAQVAQAPIVYLNMQGAQDDIIFDGGSFIVSPDGYILAEALQFETPLFAPRSPLRIGAGAHDEARPQPVLVLDQHAAIWGAMKTGLADYVRKNGFTDVVLGLSGGIDSAVTAALAVDALGAEHVQGVLLPSPYTSADSTADALETARLLGIKTTTVPITPMMEVMGETLHPVMGDAMSELAIGGNIQARIRGQILMAMSNKTGALLLSTGNKSEVAVGYTTLYGDTCGGYNVLKDAYKTQVYALARWRNEQSPAIPANSITKAPTAELAHGQKDSDQLPEYEILDQILALHLEGRKSAAEIIAQGFNAEMVKKILKLVRINEYKRRQSCPGVKISPMLFGRDRRYPITNGFT